ncbi:uncharacterized protein EV154DRAFT_488721 [Mucor mucedo]|uniref:uncharacterized protein n=1 Tax=Mucor mucedo TaxID=29922 RepID=UPI00221F7F57|nr:uncharacterized protein EV154DRAFT_488721 [Mucor mucedo]KAI7865384.1 hypothetical protein EV154DRAFT_488721 [Mucor mucedo]
MSEFMICLSDLPIVGPFNTIIATGRYFVKCFRYFAHSCTSYQGDCCQYSPIYIVVEQLENYFLINDCYGYKICFYNCYMKANYCGNSTFCEFGPVTTLSIIILFNVLILTSLIFDYVFPFPVKEELVSPKLIPVAGAIVLISTR